MSQRGKSNSPKRRWRSMEHAYNAGMAAGFASAFELVKILNDPAAFIARIEAIEKEFGNSIRAIMEDQAR